MLLSECCYTECCYLSVVILGVVIVSVVIVSVVIVSVVIVSVVIRHERDSRQSQSRSGEISKLSRRYFSGFREKVPFSLVKAAGKLRLGTTLNGTRAVHFFTFQRSDRGTEPTKTMPGKERQCSVQVRS